MKILVTGGAGFLGSNLCRRLLNEGHEVICLDNLSTGSTDNLADLPNRDRFTFIRHDIVEPVDIEAEQIYHLACPASPVHYQKDMIGTIRTCVLGTENMLKLAVKYHARILLTSTSEVYGEPLMHPQKEEYRGNVNQLGLRSCYDEGKRVAETLMYCYQREKGADIRIVRLFNTYGPYMHPEDGRVVSNFIIEALKGRDITIYGDGTQTRSFCYVSDTIEGLVRMMNQQNGFTGPVNLGNPDERSVRELANIVIELTGSRSGLVFLNLPDDDPTRRKPDISLAGEMLDWHPRVDIREGLRETIRYFSREERKS